MGWQLRWSSQLCSDISNLTWFRHFSISSAERKKERNKGKKQRNKETKKKRNKKGKKERKGEKDIDGERKNYKIIENYLFLARLIRTITKAPTYRHHHARRISFFRENNWVWKECCRNRIVYKYFYVFCIFVAVTIVIIVRIKRKNI